MTSALILTDWNRGGQAAALKPHAVFASSEPHAWTALHTHPSAQREKCVAMAVDPGIGLKHVEG